MAEKQEHPSARDLHSCSSKLVCPLSLISLLICTAALVRVETINQRVHDVEDLVADARQNHNVVKVSTDTASFKRSEKVESVQEFDHKITEEREDETEVHTGRTRRFSSAAGRKPDQLTMESVKSEINKTLDSLTLRSFCSPKQQICVQGPPGIQGPKGSRGRRGPRGVTGRKGSSGSRGKKGPHGKQGIMGPPGRKGGQGTIGPVGQKGEQGIMGPPGAKGSQGILGKLGPKGNQGIVGPPGQKGQQGIIGPPGLVGEKGIIGSSGPKGNQGKIGQTGRKGNKGIMGARGSKGSQGFMGPSGVKGKQGYMGPSGPKGNQGTVGPPGGQGQQGITGPPGSKGKQGTMGRKGEKGSIGVPGPRGFLGAKGESGNSFSPPTMVISPMKQAIARKLDAVFQCSVVGNPKPTVTWLGKRSTPLRSQDGRLEVRRLTVDDAGEYTCIGRNLLGITSQTAVLTVKEGHCTAIGVSADIYTIPDDQMTATSNYLAYYSYNGRLNGTSGWCVESRDDYSDDYLQIDMGAEYSVCAVATQGKSSGSYLTSYKLSFSTDGETWSLYQEDGEDKDFEANGDLNSIVQHSLTSYKEARYVRLIPTGSSTYPCVRVEIYVIS